MGGWSRGAFEGKGPQRRPQRLFGGRLEEVAKAVGGGYCRLQMPLKLARGTVAGHRLGGIGGGVPHPPSNVSLGQGCIRREGTSEAAPEAVRRAVGDGCQSGWGRALSVTNAIEAGTWRQGDSGWA